MRRRRNRKGQFVKGGTHKRRVTRRRRRSAPVVARRRRVAVAIANPRRRRRHTRRRHHAARRNAYLMNPRRTHRRHYRRNPDMLSAIGFNQPTLKAVGFTVVGLAGTPFIEGFITPYIPAAIGQNAFGKYAVKVAAALGLSWGVKKVAGPEAGRAVMVGGIAYVAVSLIRDFLPTLLPASSSTGLYSMGAQPLLGAKSGLSSPMTTAIPDRWNPSGRF